jgi:hypothetical protein
MGQVLDRGERVGLKAFLDHDDNDVMVAIKAWAEGPDAVLAALAERFLRRRKLRLVWEAQTLDEDLKPAARKRIQAYFEKRHPGDGGAWLIEDRLGGPPYDPREPVMVAGPRGAQELSRRSKIVRDIAGPHLHARYYVPQEDAAKVRALIARNG